MAEEEVSLILILAKINGYARYPLIFPDKESDLELSVVSHAVSWLFGRLAGWLVD